MNTKGLIGVGIVAAAIAAWLWTGEPTESKRDEISTSQAPLESTPRVAPAPTAVSSVADVSRDAESLRDDIREVAVRPASDSLLPALPGISGFYVSPGDGAVSTLASALASEAEDEAWSDLMEGSVLDQISRLHNLEVVSVNVECRSATCGALLVFARDIEDSSRIVNFPRIADALGFPLRAGLPTIADDGTPFTAFYMQMDPEFD